MAWQFPDILGLRRADPMMSDLGIDPLVHSEQVMLEQAAKRTASISFDEVKTEDGVLSARVKVDNRAGHKFPSGVAFRRAFIEFNVLGADNQVMWASGRTNGVGVIVDDKRKPIAGELWWRHDCSARIDPMARIHQPHYQVITRQDQAQIYEELLSTPPDVAAPKCGVDAQPAGQLTTSFLSICSKVKDNRLLPHGFLKLDDRIEISRALGAGAELAQEAGPAAVGDDPDYRTGGGDSLVYRVPLVRAGGQTGRRAGDDLLSGDAAQLPSGPLLHVEEQRHQASLLSDRQIEPRRHTRPGLEAESRQHRSGGGAVSYFATRDIVETRDAEAGGQMSYGTNIADMFKGGTWRNRNLQQRRRQGEPRSRTMKHSLSVP